MRQFAKRGVLAVALATTPSHGLCQDGSGNASEETPELIQSLFKCQDVTTPEERLTCFDSSVAAIQAAEGKDELIFADRERMREARRGHFGFNPPKIQTFKEGAEEQVSSLTAKIASASETATGRWLFVLEDGARWVQTDSTPVFGSPGRGDTILIEQAALGSYKAKINDKRAIRVQRIK